MESFYQYIALYSETNNSQENTGNISYFISGPFLLKTTSSMHPPPPRTLGALLVCRGGDVKQNWEGGHFFIENLTWKE